MFITITSVASGLIVGQGYDLCDTAAKDLIGKGQAVEITAKAEIKKVEKEAAKRTADKKIARLAGNLAVVVEKAEKATKEALVAVEVAKKAQAKAEKILADAQDADTGDADPDSDDDKDADTEAYTGDFSEFDDEAVRLLAGAAGLPDNVTNPATIRKKLVSAGFDPRKKENDDNDE